MTEALPAEFSLGADAGTDLALSRLRWTARGHETVARLEPGIAFQIQRAVQFAPENCSVLPGLGSDRAFDAYREVRKRLEHYEPPQREDPQRGRIMPQRHR